MSCKSEMAQAHFAFCIFRTKSLPLTIPYVLSPKIVLNSEIMWMEGPVYEKENLYRIQEGKPPSVNYDVHKLKPHSLTHAEGSLHVLNPEKDIYHWEVSKAELIQNLQRVIGHSPLPDKLILSSEHYSN